MANQAKIKYKHVAIAQDEGRKKSDGKYTYRVEPSIIPMNISDKCLEYITYRLYVRCMETATGLQPPT